MALSNYSDLQDTISDFIMRPGDTSVPVKSFITLAEGDIAPFIKHYAQEAEVTLATVSNVLTLPTDLVETRRIIVDGVLAKPLSPYNTVPLLPGEIGYFQTGATYTISPSQTAARSVKLVYYKRVPALSDAATTNWLLTQFPAVYLHASLARAYRWLKDPQAEAGEKQSLAEAMSLVAADNSRVVNSGNPISVETSSW